MVHLQIQNKIYTIILIYYLFLSIEIKKREAAIIKRDSAYYSHM